VVTSAELFGQVVDFPNPDAQRRLAALVGIDNIKGRLIAEASLLLEPSVLTKWSRRHYGTVTPAVEEVSKRTPLVVLAGDVGTGKTELAETFGDAVARSLRVDVTLYPMSLSTRGKGAVGEMTTLLTAAFDVVRAVASKGRARDGRVTHGVVLLIDEADALAQSRELAQMHHEDRAGVNALIRGIDGLRNDQLPVLTVLCSNRLDALDPAVLRRAAATFPFARPDDDQRRLLLSRLLDRLDLADAEIDKVVELTGPRADRPYGSTYSDLRQRLVPGVVLDAFRADVPITGDRVVAFAETFAPTRPFRESE
jgi:SpoVK/Ycf46/Vps4 family AAA+-type ATPase